MAFALLSDPELGLDLDLCAAGRGRSPTRTRVRHLARSRLLTLLLHCRPGCSNYVSDLWS
jgi:hypothetical protein